MTLDENIVYADIPAIPDDTLYLGEKLDEVRRAVEALGSSRDDPAPNIRVFKHGVGQVWSVRTRIVMIRMVHDASSNVSMFIGTASYFMRVRVDCDNLYPLPFIIEPGQELRFDLPVANTVFTVYVVSYPVEADPRFDKP